jgi:acetyltransferase-like isoleucine patch superfamily enzyme
MPVDHLHAFADGPVYFRPRWPWQAGAKAWAQFARHASMGARCRLGPRAWCVNRLGDTDRIRLADGVVCRGLLRVEEFGDGRIQMEQGVYVGDDCLLSAAHGITLGAGVLLAHGVQIFDNDSHPVEIEARRADMRGRLTGEKPAPIASGPVTIGADAWIGMQTLILKGANIGAGSVVAAGSVVVGDVPAHSVAAGNPARVIKTLRPS